MMESKLPLTSHMTDSADAAEWVRQHSKRVEEQQKEREERPRKRARSRQYKSGDIDGVHVDVDIGDVEAGADHILTLKDTTILDEKGRKLADSEDHLESIALREKVALKQKHEDEAKLSRYKSMGVAYDLFEESTVIHDDGTVEKRLLPQYDEGKKTSGFKLDGGSAVDPAIIQRQRAAVRARLSKVDTGNQVYDASLSSQLPAADYLTPSEVVSFKKGKKKRKKTRQLRAEDDEVKPVRKRVIVVDDDDEEEDSELVDHITRARREAMSKNVPTAVIQRATQVRSEIPMDRDHNGIVFSETTEFVRTVADAQETYTDQQQAMVDTDQQQAMVEEPMSKPMPIETEIKKEEEMDEEEVEEEELLVDERSVAVGVGGALNLMRMQGNLTDTIELAGRTNDTRTYDTVAAPDIKGVADESFKEGLDRFKDVKLEYIDEFGRHMTPKEAFRQQSHIFHGTNPGKNKKALRIKQYEDDIKRKQLRSGEAALKTAERMRVIQEVTQQPFVMLKGQAQDDMFRQ